MIYDLSQPPFNNVPPMLDGRTRHFAVFPVLIQGAGGAWTRAVAWDEGEMA